MLFNFQHLVLEQSFILIASMMLCMKNFIRINLLSKTTFYYELTESWVHRELCKNSWYCIQSSTNLNNYTDRISTLTPRLKFASLQFEFFPWVRLVVRLVEGSTDSSFTLCSAATCSYQWMSTLLYQADISNLFHCGFSVQDFHSARLWSRL